MMIFPRGRAGVRLDRGAKLSKTYDLRWRLGALLLIAQITCSLCGLVAGRRHTEWKRCQSVLFNHEQLAIAEK